MKEKKDGAFVQKDSSPLIRVTDDYTAKLIHWSHILKRFTVEEIVEAACLYNDKKVGRTIGKLLKRGILSKTEKGFTFAVEAPMQMFNLGREMSEYLFSPNRK